MRTPILLLLLAGCRPGYAPPDWLLGSWTTFGPGNDTSWFEWEFQPDDVLRHDYHSRTLEETVEIADAGARESTAPGVYRLTSILGEDTYDGFLQTDDPDVVIWESVSPFHVVDTQVPMDRVVDDAAETTP